MNGAQQSRSIVLIRAHHHLGVDLQITFCEPTQLPQKLTSSWILQEARSQVRVSGMNRNE
jgi:ABC-type uncharacterized transport system substrate-binding protein